MKIRERYAIDRPPAAVWPCIIRPESFARNTKISSMDAMGEFRLGQANFGARVGPDPLKTLCERGD
jgi:hypothetical protein